jgi:hypothetical protein
VAERKFGNPDGAFSEFLLKGRSQEHGLPYPGDDKGPV